MFCEMGLVLVKVVKVNCCLGELCQIKTETKGAKLYRGQKMNETFRVIFKHGASCECQQQSSRRLLKGV